MAEKTQKKVAGLYFDYGLFKKIWMSVLILRTDYFQKLLQVLIIGGLIFPRMNSKFVIEKLITAIQKDLIVILLNYLDISLLVH